MQATHLDPREFTLAHIAKQADVVREDYDAAWINLAFEVVSQGYERADRSVGFAGGATCEMRCVGARLTYMGEIALTREQTIELVGALRLAEAEQYEAERRAEQMEGV
jgi:hypothetical protein